MRVALEEEDVLPNVVRARQSTIDVAKLERDELVDVVGAAVILDALVLRRRQRGLDRHHRFEALVCDHDRVTRGGRDLLLGRGDRRDRVADVAHFLVLEGALVLRHRQDAELDRQVRAGDHGLDAGDPARGGSIDREDARVGMRAAKDLAVERTGQQHVVGVDGATGHLGRSVNLGQRLPNDAQAHLPTMWGGRRRSRRVGRVIHRILPAASSMACKILV